MKLGYLLVIPFVIAVAFLADMHSRQVMVSGEAYEECIMEKYGTTPWYWYAQTGEYPTCSDMVGK
jgi:hypothetical protein